MRTYTRAQIQARRTDLMQLPDDIQTIQKELIRLNANLHNLINERDQRQRDHLGPLNAKIHAAEARVLVLDLPPQIERLRNDIASEQEILRTLRRDRDSLTARIQPIEELIRKLILAKEICIAENENRELDNILSRERNIVARCDAELSALRGRVSAKEAELSSARSSLNHYQSLQQQANYNSAMMAQTHHHHDGYTSFGAGMYSSSINPYTGEISNANNQISSLEQDISTLRINIATREAERMNAIARRDAADRERSINLNIIANNKGSLLGFNYGSLLEVQLRLNSNTQMLEPLIAQRKGIILDIDKHEAREKNLTADTNNKSRTLETARRNDTVYTHLNKNEIVATMQKLESDIAPHIKDQRVTEDAISQTQTVITNQEKDLAARQKRLKEHTDNVFLAEFDAHPLHQLNTLRDRIFAALKEYEQNNQRLVCIEVRRCLYEHQARINFIVGTTDDQHAEGLEQHKTRFEHLTGYLWSLSERNYADKQLKQTILNALGKDALDKAETMDLYRAYALQAPAQLRDYTNDDIADKEENDYNEAYNAFNQALATGARHPGEVQLYKTGRNLLNSIHKTEGDTAYRTQLLKASRDLLMGYYITENHTKLHNLATLNTHGVRSIPKIVCGALMMFLGVAGIAACIGLAVATYGIASPFMIAGIVASAAVFSGGLTLMLTGLNKGVQRSLINFEKVAHQASQDEGLHQLRKNSMFRPIAHSEHGDGSAPVADDLRSGEPYSPYASAPPLEEKGNIYPSAPMPYL